MSKTNMHERGLILRCFSGGLKAMVAALLALLCTAVTLGTLSLTDLATTPFWHASQGIVGGIIFGCWTWVWWKAVR